MKGIIGRERRGGSELKRSRKTQKIRRRRSLKGR